LRREQLDIDPGGITVARIQRRDFAKGMIAIAASAKTLFGQQEAAPTAVTSAPTPPTALAPMPLSGGLDGITSLPMTSYVPDEMAETAAHFFDTAEMATLRKLGDVFMPPRKGYPGSEEAGAPEFLDFLIGVSGEDRQQMYKSGLNKLDEEATHKFGMQFANLSAPQIDELIRPWLRTWMPDHPPTELFARFINVAHSDLRAATINSQAWNEKAKDEGHRAEGVQRYWFPVDPDIHREAAQSCVQTSVKKLSRQG
jgi:hypothetical protein